MDKAIIPVLGTHEPGVLAWGRRGSLAYPSRETRAKSLLSSGNGDTKDS